MSFFCFVVMSLTTMLGLLAWKSDQYKAMAAFLLAAAVFGYFGYTTSRPEYIAKQEADERRRVAAEQAQDLRDRTPHVIREFEGCKVYQFKLGDKWPIVTRCPGDRTVTDRPFETCHTEGSGKTARKVCEQHVESIEVTP